MPIDCRYYVKRFMPFKKHVVEVLFIFYLLIFFNEIKSEFIPLILNA